MPNPDAVPDAVRLTAADWQAYAAGLRASTDPAAARLLPLVESAARSPQTALALSRAERALLREIDQHAADAVMRRRPGAPRERMGR